MELELDSLEVGIAGGAVGGGVILEITKKYRYPLSVCNKNSALKGEKLTRNARQDTTLFESHWVTHIDQMSCMQDFVDFCAVV